jgi:cob(I)alamin adenosyltransferase
MKVYTKTGDDGTTFMPGEGDKGRVKKYDCSVDAQGDLDELNAWVGHLRVKYFEGNHDRCHHYEPLCLAQDVLMRAGSQLATSKQYLKQNDIDLLEKLIDAMTAVMPPLKNFILPVSASEIHIARTVCRRAERNIAMWRDRHSGGPDKFELIVPYLNRFSDYLFTLARFTCQITGQEEIVWKANE